MSGLIRIQTFWHSYGITKRFYRKKKIFFFLNRTKNLENFPSMQIVIKSALLVNFMHIGLANSLDPDQAKKRRTWPRGYKTFFMLNSAEHEIYPARKC